MAKIVHKDDYNLVHSYLLGDRDAGRELYADVIDFVRAYIYERTKSDILDSNDKEDILNETLKTSIERLDRFDGTSKFSTFVIGIAKNKIYEKIRSKDKQMQNEVEYIDIASLHSRDPLAIILDKEQMVALENAINSLSDDHKHIIQLRMNNMSSKSIAEITDKSVDAVDSMYRRALKALKDIYSRSYN